MLIKPPIEVLLPKVANRYVLTLLTAKRARQLVDGGQPMTSHDESNTVSTAAWELAEDSLQVVPGRLEPVVPLRPEIEAQRLEAEALARAKREEALMEEGRRQEGPSAFRESIQAQIAETDERQQDNTREFTEQLIRLIGRNAEEIEGEEPESMESLLAASDEQ